MQRAVVTLACGTPYYVRLASNLARSFKVWHKESHIRFVFITDQPESVPPDLSDLHIITVAKNHLPAGFASKLHLYDLSPAEETLFIDSDCLCFGPLEEVFEIFHEHDFSSLGRMLTEGDVFGDIAQRKRSFGVASIPHFVGALYYFRKSEKARAIFKKSLELMERYDDIGMLRLAGLPNEEPLFGLAMALAGESVVHDDCSIKADVMYFPKRISVSVYNGSARLEGEKKRDVSVPFDENITIAHPRIVHFNYNYSETGEYRAQCYILNKVQRQNWPASVAEVVAQIRYTLTDRTAQKVRSLVRPFYRRLFGVRPVKMSKRFAGK